jgi:hypothetical protein
MLYCPDAASMEKCSFHVALQVAALWHSRDSSEFQQEKGMEEDKNGTEKTRERNIN